MNLEIIADDFWTHRVTFDDHAVQQSSYSVIATHVQTCQERPLHEVPHQPTYQKLYSGQSEPALDNYLVPKVPQSNQ